MDVYGFNIGMLRKSLKTSSHLSMVDKEGRRLWFVRGPMLGHKATQVLIAYEGHGACLVDMKDEVNQFQLVSGGFDLLTANIMAAVLNAVFRKPNKPPVTGASTTTLSLPKPAG